MDTASIIDMNMDKQNVHTCREWTRTCSMGMELHHGNGQAPWIWTCTMDTDMGMDRDIDYYWNDAVGRTYAKVRNYAYIDIVITTFANCKS